MLRTLVFALLIGAPSLAAAEQFPASPLGQEVRGDDGQVIGRVTAVERDGHGRIVAVEIPGLEPPDAPSALVAENQREGPVVRRDAAARERARQRAATTQIRIR